MRGRKPTPAKLKILRGNPGRRPIKKEPEPKAGIPEAPAHLSKAAREEWDRLTAELHACGLLSVCDRGELAAYCQVWGRIVDLEEQIAGLTKGKYLLKGNSGVYMNPIIGILNRQYELLAKFGSEFGLSPASRSRIRHETKEETENKLAAFMSG